MLDTFVAVFSFSALLLVAIAFVTALVLDLRDMRDMRKHKRPVHRGFSVVIREPSRNPTADTKD